MNENFRIYSIGVVSQITCGFCGQSESFISGKIEIKIKQFKRAHQHTRGHFVKAKFCVNKMLNSLSTEFA
ncbi:MAG: hypothetical protein WA584_23385 [Pyrinomonadaceae bacterium]